MQVPKATSAERATLPKLDNITKDLNSRGFRPAVSIWPFRQGTVARLQELKAFDGGMEKYGEYLNFFKALHTDLRMPIELTLILPKAEELFNMDVTELLQHVPLIRKNFTSSESRTCDLRKLPEFYPSLFHLSKFPPK